MLVSDSAMMHIPVLVTGGAGYIGSHAVLALVDAGWHVTIIDDLSTGRREVIPDGLRFYEGSIADPGLLERILLEQGIKAILHFAGSIVVPESIERPLDYYRNNTLASHTLIAAAMRAGVKHILFSSTAAVYGAPSRVPVGEDDVKAPINPYGASKLMTERMLEDASKAYSFNYGALRYFNVAGADPAGRTGLIGRGSTHLIKVAVEAAVGKRDHVAVYGNNYPTPDGTCIRDFIHVSDLAAVHVAALEKLIEKPYDNLVLNCGYGCGLSVLQVLDAVDRANGKPIKRRFEERRVGDPPALVACNARLLKTLNWRPARGKLDAIVSDALSWERKLARL